MNAILNLIGRRARVWHSRGRGFSLLVVLALLLQIGLPGSIGMQVAQAAGPGGPSGTMTHNTAADFNTASCAVLTNTTVTNYNTDGEVRLLASLEDYFNGTEVDSSLWNSGPVNPIDYPQYTPTVAGGLVTLDGSYMQSTTLFNQSGRFMEARVLMRATSLNTTYLDVGFYRAIPPNPPSTGSAITADTAVRLFLTTASGMNDLDTRLADGTQVFFDNEIAEPEMTLWHTYRINWGAVDTDFLIDGTSFTTMTEQLSTGDTLGARILLYHQEPSPEFATIAPMQVDWIRAGQYPSAGEFLSCVYDATGIVNFRNATWLADVPAGSGLTIQTRTAQDDTNTWSAWSIPIDAASASSATLTNPSGRYFQYRLNFTSASLIQSAELRQIQVNYFGPTSLDVTPASPTVNPGATQQFTAAVSDGVNPITGLTVNWSVTGTPGNGSIDSDGLYTAPLTAGTYSNVVNASVDTLPSGTLSDTVSVTVPNVPPLSDAGGPYNGAEGALIPLAGTGSDPNGGSVTFAWDLDFDGQYDDSGVQNPNFSASDDGTFTVGLQVTDTIPSSTTDTATVNVANVAPTATFNAPTTVNEGSPILISLSSPSDPSSVDTTAGFEYAFDCGSGYGAYSSTNNVSCPTTDNSILAVGGRIRDKDLGVSTYTANVTVANVAPTATFNAPTTVNEGSPILLSLSSPSDPSSVDATTGFEYAFDCGSGYGAYSSTNNVSCPTTDNSILAVGGRIRDKDLGISTYTANVTVANVAPTATFNAPTTVNEGSPILISLSSPSDPSSVDVTAGFEYAFDCGSGYGSYSSTNNVSCPTNDEATPTVGARIRDKDLGVTEYTSLVTVVNVAPTASSFNVTPGPVNEGADFTLTLAEPYFDPSTVDTAATFTFAFDCGSGTFSPESPTNNITCPTTDDGILNVRGRIMDADGGNTIYTGSITVGNIAPVITSVTNNGPVLVGAFAQITVNVTAFAGDVLTYEFDCDNNGVYEVGPQSGNIGSCAFSAGGMNTVSVRVNDDDGSSDTDTTDVDVTPTTVYFYLPVVVVTP